MGRVCDYCSTAKAVIFCRADSARLCLACDKQVRELPVPINGETIGLPGTEWANPRRRASRGARSRSMRRRKRALDATRLFDEGTCNHDDAKQTFPASSRDARQLRVGTNRHDELRHFLTVSPLSPPPRCTRRIRWLGDTSVRGCVMLVRTARRRCVGARASNIVFARVCRSGEPDKILGV